MIYLNSDIAIIIPANNEEKYIGRCLKSLLMQTRAPSMLIVVYCNGCTDSTYEISMTFCEDFSLKGHNLICVNSPEAGKIGALNAAEHVIDSEYSSKLPRVFLDADVVCGSEIIGKISKALSNSNAVYATGKMKILDAKSTVTKAYTAFWKKMPFFNEVAIGAGLFAVNYAARVRWNEFPDIISDDTFVRLHFSPDERVEVTENYFWPVPEGFMNLVKVRKRQDQGVWQIMELYPELAQNDAKAQAHSLLLAFLFIRHPFGFFIYSLIKLLSISAGKDLAWTRGR